MPIEVIDTIKPKNGQDFPIVEAEHVKMPDGSRLSDFSAGAYPELEGAAELQPETWYVFGEVSSLELTLAETDDGKAHEYCFEFIPTTDDFTLTVSPAPSWVVPCFYIAGKTHQVSILRGVGVMIRA